MIINCLHGYFIVREDTPGEVAKFNSWYGKELTRQEDYYTFAELTDFPEYSLLGKVLINLPAIATYCGRPWEILEENEMVYNISTGLLVPKLSSPVIASIYTDYEFYFSNGLIQPGQITDSGKLILGYSGRFDFDTTKFSYSELVYD